MESQSDVCTKSPATSGEANGAVILGDTVTDRITGFSGVITAVTTYLAGTPRVFVEPTIAADGAYREGQWLDIDRAVLTI